MNDWSQIPDSAILFHPFSGSKFLVIDALMDNHSPIDQVSTVSPPENETSQQAYDETFDKIISAIKTGNCSKIILSRTKLVTHNLAAIEIFDRLNNAYPGTFNYLISNSEIGTWIGATPEQLISVEEGKLQTMALAGTKTKDENWTSKEFDEQAFVTQQILKDLKPYCSQISATGPSTINAGPVQHLLTKISGTLSDKSQWKQLASLLHPTPAVCGTPTNKAMEFIQINEQHDRLFYTGFIGVLSPESKSLFVNLRCMEYFPSVAKLYLGGGIIKNSDPQKEWEETERKAKTLTDLLGN